MTGIVRHLDDQCIGCKYCTMMCPYEVPQYSKRLGIVRKCDMCHQRLSVGEAPACVQSCPNEAIKIRIVDSDPAASAGECLVPSAPQSAITQPTTVYRSTQKLDAQTSWPQDKNVDEVAESHWPLALMLVATEVSVGILIAEVLAALLLRLAGFSIPAGIPLAAAGAAFAIGNLGLGIAPLHLGQPLRMWRVFLGLRTSWLSREAVVLGKYMGLLALGLGLLGLPFVWDWIPSAIQEWIPRQWIPSWGGRAAAVLSIPLGVAGLYCSAMIYIATKRTLWRAERTLPRFFGTALVAGPIVASSIFAFGGFPVTAGLLSLLGALAIVWKWRLERLVYLQPNEQHDEFDLRSMALIRRHLAPTRQARNVLAGLSLTLAVIGTFVCIAAPTIGGVIAVTAAVTILSGEFLERLLYFQSVVYDRMPGTL